jgi:flavin-dependent dehydrogenase
MYDYDMVVIGSGPSGRRAAVQFAKLGRSVLVVEKGRISECRPRERGDPYAVSLTLRVAA